MAWNWDRLSCIYLNIFIFKDGNFQKWRKSIKMDECLFVHHVWIIKMKEMHGNESLEFGALAPWLAHKDLKVLPRWTISLLCITKLVYIQGETELSFRLIPSLAKITSSLTVLVRGFVWDWVKEVWAWKIILFHPVHYIIDSPCIRLKIL